MRTVTDAPDPALYETDFFSWTQQQAALLRGGDLRLADLANIAEEIETLGRSERSALESAYRLIALHLLKLQFRPARKTRSLIVTVTRERLNAARILRENPGLKPRRKDLFASAYRDARKEAAAETGLLLSTVPDEPPFDVQMATSEDFLPRASPRSR